MADRNSSTVQRRSILGLGGTLAGAMTVVPWVLVGEAQAAGVAKDAVGYQDTPNDGKQCSACAHFVRGNSTTGTCKVVAGEVSPRGWCSVWTG